MHKNLLIVIIIISVIVNLLLLNQNLTLRNDNTAQATTLDDNCLFPDSSYLVDNNGVKEDVRGLYSFPGFGRYIVPPRADDPSKAPFSMVVFLAAKTIGDKDNCQPCLDEFTIYERLDTLFKSREQQILYACEQPDSIAVADYLAKMNISNELLVFPVDSSMSFYKLGISYRSMPFKILFDSNFTAIYMRGANSYLPAQLEFERAVTFLSDISIGKIN